jgi:hypothetical protein
MISWQTHEREVGYGANQQLSMTSWQAHDEKWGMGPANNPGLIVAKALETRGAAVEFTSTVE